MTTTEPIDERRYKSAEILLQDIHSTAQGICKHVAALELYGIDVLQSAMEPNAMEAVSFMAEQSLMYAGFLVKDLERLVGECGFFVEDNATT